VHVNIKSPTPDKPDKVRGLAPHLTATEQKLAKYTMFIIKRAIKYLPAKQHSSARPAGHIIDHKKGNPGSPSDVNIHDSCWSVNN